MKEIVFLKKLQVRDNVAYGRLVTTVRELLRGVTKREDGGEILVRIIDDKVEITCGIVKDSEVRE